MVLLYTHMFGELAASTFGNGWSDGMNAGWLACSTRPGCRAVGSWMLGCVCSMSGEVVWVFPNPRLLLHGLQGHVKSAEVDYSQHPILAPQC